MALGLWVYVGEDLVWVCRCTCNLAIQGLQSDKTSPVEILIILVVRIRSGMGDVTAHLSPCVRVADIVVSIV